MKHLIRAGLAAITLGLIVGIALHRLDADEKEAVPATADEHFEQLVSAFNDFIESPPKEDPKEEDFRKEYTPKLTKMMASCESLAAREDATDRQKQLAEQVKMKLVQLGGQFDTEFAKEIIKKYPGTEFAAMADAQLLLRKINQGELSEKMLGELEGFAKKYKTSKFPPQMYLVVAESFVAKGEEKSAIETVETALKLFPNSPHEQEFNGVLKSLKMIGSVIEVTGPTLAGTEFKLDSQKGKVVLIDFWATWCGPCVASLPGLQKIYDNYHEQGFEVVGISLDNSKKDLEDFVKEKELKWPQIFFDDAEKAEWNNPLAAKFEVNSIPRMILVGRDGKVVSSNIRGEDVIEEAVKKELAKESAVKAN